MIDLKNAKRLFDEYVANYDKDNPKVALKIEHTYRVMEASKNVAVSLGLDQDEIDLASLIGLLHDIGRVLEYKEEIPHHEGSVIIAKDILKETSFTKEEKDEILKGIENHRKDSIDELSRIIYESDKLSRNCFSCKSEKDCYWSKEKKNFKIKY